MFAVDEPAAEAIRRAFDESGELAAIVELRRHLPLVSDNVGDEQLALGYVNRELLSPQTGHSSSPLWLACADLLHGRGNPFNVIGPAERNFPDCSRATAGHAHQHRTRSQAFPSGPADHLVARVSAHYRSYASARSDGVSAGRLDAVKRLRRSAARHARGSLASGVGRDGARVRAGTRRGDFAAVGTPCPTTAPGQPAARQERASADWCAWRCGRTSRCSSSPRQAPSCSACLRATG